MPDYRHLSEKEKIEPGSGGPCFLVFCHSREGGNPSSRLFGFLIFQAYSKEGGAEDEIYLLSDFVVPSVRHPRLAKLLLMAVRCKEMRETLEAMHMRRYSSILTTAFTDKPVSMKYRGVFELAKRGDGFLNYKAEFTDASFTEVIGLWMKKYRKS